MTVAVQLYTLIEYERLFCKQCRTVMISKTIQLDFYSRFHSFLISKVLMHWI